MDVKKVKDSDKYLLVRDTDTDKDTDTVTNTVTNTDTNT